jgi:hypothetical protein
MVVRRTIENLRARPKDERTAIAASIALGVVAVLFVGWVVYFFYNLEANPIESPANSSNTTPSQQVQATEATTTQFMDVEGNVETQQIGTSTDSQ